MSLMLERLLPFGSQLDVILFLSGFRGLRGSADIHGALRMAPNYFGNPALTFLLNSMMVTFVGLSEATAGGD